MLIKIQILSIIILQSFFSISQNYKLIHEYNFDKNESGWWTGKRAIGSCTIHNGKYVIEYKGKKSWLTSVNTKIDYKKDFLIESTIGKLRGTNKNGFGIVWGRGIEGYYNFVITGHGKFYVRKVKKNGDSKYLINWRKSKTIRKFKSINKISIEKRGNEILFYVNNYFIAKIPFESFFGDKVGFVVYDRHKIRVHNLYIYQKKEKLIEPKTFFGKISNSDLQIVKFIIDDGKNTKESKVSGNGNNIVEAGETIKLTIFVQNKGNDNAINVKAKVYLKTKSLFLSFLNKNRIYDLSDIKRGEFKKIVFYFYIGKKFNKENIKFKIKFKEVFNTNRKTFYVKVPFAKGFSYKTEEIFD